MRGTMGKHAVAKSKFRAPPSRKVGKFLKRAGKATRGGKRV